MSVKGGTKYRKFKSKYCAKYLRFLITNDENLGVLIPKPKWGERIELTKQRLIEIYEQR